MQTPLYSWHKNAKAKIIDFSGYDMPLHFGSQLEEHHAVRQQAGMFDVSHMGVIDIKGEGALALLQKACANDVAKLSINRALYTCMLNSQAGVIDDLIVYYLEDNYYRLVVNAGTKQKDLAWLATLNKEFKAVIELRTDYSIVAVQGPQARSLVAPLLTAELLALKPFHCLAYNGCLMASTGYTGEDGVEIIIPNNQVEEFWQACVDAGIRPCGLAARDTLRLEAGLNLYGNDMDETVCPYAANLAWTVCLKDASRDFVGKKVLEKTAIDDCPMQMIGVVMNESGVLRAGQKILIDGAVVGKITSGSFSPTLEQAIGFARLPKAADTNHLYVERRNQLIALQQVKLPFIKKGQKTF